MLQILIVAFGILSIPLIVAAIFDLKLTQRSWQLLAIGVGIATLTIVMLRIQPTYGRAENFIEHAMGGGVPSAFMLAALLAAQK